jgi:hypothetical protein
VVGVKKKHNLEAVWPVVKKGLSKLEVTFLNVHSAGIYAGTKYRCLSTFHRFWQRTPTNWTHFIIWQSHKGELALGHLTLCSLTRFISSGSRVLLIWFFLFPVDVFGPTEIFRDGIVFVAVPAKELFFTWGKGEVFVSPRALRRVIDRGCLFLLTCHCPNYFSEDSFSCFFRRF